MKNVVLFIMVLIVWSCSQEIKKSPEPQKTGIVFGGVKVSEQCTCLHPFPKSWNKDIKVTLLNEKNQFVTNPDTNGKYFFSNIPYGYYSIRFEREKFVTTQRDSILINKSDTTYINVPPYVSPFKYLDVAIFKSFTTSITGFENYTSGTRQCIYVNLTFAGLNEDTNSYTPSFEYLISNNSRFLNDNSKNWSSISANSFFNSGNTLIFRYNQQVVTQNMRLFCIQDQDWSNFKIGDTLYLKAWVGGNGVTSKNEFSWWEIYK